MTYLTILDFDVAEPPAGLFSLNINLHTPTHCRVDIAWYVPIHCIYIISVFQIEHTNYRKPGKVRNAQRYFKSQVSTFGTSCEPSQAALRAVVYRIFPTVQTLEG